MNLSSLWAKARTSQPLAIVVVTLAVALGLQSFEIVSGLPASVRGTPVYGALELQKSASSAMHRAAPRLSSPTTQRLRVPVRVQMKSARQARARARMTNGKAAQSQSSSVPARLR